MNLRLEVTLAVVCTAAAVPSPAYAQQIRIRTVDCAKGVHLTADGAPTSDVLQQLAKAGGFRITAAERIASTVTIDSIQPTQRLLTGLLGAENMIMSEEPDPRCPGRYRVVDVWLVRRASPTGTASPPQRVQPVIPPGTITPQAREQDELYKRAHGMLPE